MRTAAHAIPRRRRDDATVVLDTVSELFAMPYRVLVTLRLWQARSAYRKTLMSLDAHRLADIGLSQAEALREIQKPFWVE
jgi:uncharacterized protein YjiS (DUF1127 family)